MTSVGTEPLSVLLLQRKTECVAKRGIGTGSKATEKNIEESIARPQNNHSNVQKGLELSKIR